MLINKERERERKREREKNKHIWPFFFFLHINCCNFGIKKLFVSSFYAWRK